MSRELELFLKIYNKGRDGPYSLYINNMEGARLLAYWLLGVSNRVIVLGDPVPWWKSTWEVQELANIINISEKDLLQALEDSNQNFPLDKIS